MSLIVSSKGSVSVLIVIIAGLLIAGAFGLAFTGYAANFAMEEINTALQADSTMTNNSKTILQDKTDQFKLWWDGVIPLLALAVVAGAFIAGSSYDKSALGLVIFIVLVVVFSYVAMSMNNAYDEIADDLPEFNIPSNFPYTHMIMSNLAVLIIGTLLSFGVGIFIGSKVGI